jgi:ABC-type Na+ efflux pump permease subunit
MPCENCGRHFTQQLANMPNTVAIRTRAGLLKWITDVKNDVNRKRGTTPVLTTDQIIEVLNQKNADPAAVEEKKKTGPTTTTTTETSPPTTPSSTNSSPHSLTSIIILAIAVVLLGTLIWRGLRVHRLKARKNHKGSKKSQ